MSTLIEKSKTTAMYVSNFLYKLHIYCELHLFAEYYIHFCNYYMFGVSSICLDLHCQVAFPEGMASHLGDLSKGVPLYAKEITI